MAKSLRSKWKRKMKAVKRVRYGEKELAKLKMIVEASKTSGNTSSEDIEMTDAQNLVKYVPKWRPSRMARRPDIFGAKPATDPKPEVMETGDDKNPNTFPIWMGSHKKRKLIRENRELNKLKKKQMKKEQKKKKR